MIKKIISVFIVVISLSSCSYKSKNCDIFDFIKRYNCINETENLNYNDIYCSDNILYWCIDKDTCVSFYINEKTGNIEKCNIVYKKENKELFAEIEETIKYNNEYISKIKFKTEKYYLISLIDSRYNKTINEEKLKKDINERDLY